MASGSWHLAYLTRLLRDLSSRVKRLPTQSNALIAVPYGFLQPPGLLTSGRMPEMIALVVAYVLFGILEYRVGLSNSATSLTCRTTQLRTPTHALNPTDATDSPA